MGLGALLKGGEPAQCSPGWTSRGAWNHLVETDSRWQSPIPLTRKVTRLSHLICLLLYLEPRLRHQSGGVNRLNVSSCVLTSPTGKQPSAS